MIAADLPTLGPIDRAALTECFDLFEEIEKGLEALPYRLAVAQLGNIGTIREHLANAFPGGLAGACEYCGELIGYDEIGASDRENGGHACKACVAKDPAHFAPPPPPSPEGDRLRAEATGLLEASAAAATTDEAIELRMDAARSGEAAERADAAAAVPDPDGWLAWEAPAFSQADALPWLVTKDTPVDSRMGDGTVFSHSPAGLWLWHTLPDPALVITAYRLSPEAAEAFPVPQPQEAPAQAPSMDF